MPAWVELHRKGEAPLVWQRFASTAERRAFYVYDSGAAEIKPIGICMPGLFETWHLKAVGFVRLLPMTTTYTFAPILTKERIPLEIEASLTLVPKTTDEMLRRIAIDTEEQERQVADALTSVVQTAYAEMAWERAIGMRAELAARIFEGGVDKLGRIGSPFTLQDVTILDVVADESLSDHPVAKVKAGMRAKEELAGEEHRLKLAIKSVAREDVDAEARIARALKAVEKEVEGLKIKARLAKSSEGRYVIDPERETRILIEVIRAVGRAREEDRDLLIERAISQMNATVAQGLLKRLAGVTWAEPENVITNLERSVFPSSSSVPDTPLDRNESKEGEDPLPS